MTVFVKSLKVDAVAVEVDLCRTLPPRFLMGMFYAYFNNFLPAILPTALNDILSAPKRMPTMGMFICVHGSNSRKLPVCVFIGPSTPLDRTTFDSDRRGSKVGVNHLGWGTKTHKRQRFQVVTTLQNKGIKTK